MKGLNISNKWCFIVFSFILLVIYYPARHYTIFNDSLDFMALMKHQGWLGIKNSFGFTSLYYMHDFLNLFFYTFFNNNSTLWYILGVLWHAFNCTLFYVFLKNILQLVNIKNEIVIAFLIALLLLCSCMQSENVLYTATFQYAYIFSVLFYKCNLFLQHQLNGEKINWRKNIFLHIIFIAGLLAQEVVILFPLIFLFQYVLVEKIRDKKITVKKITPFLYYFIWVGLYFIATKIILGSWLPHYGIRHLQGYSFNNLLEVFSKNILKNIFFIDHINGYYRNKIFISTYYQQIILALFAICIFSVFYIYKYKNKQLSWLLLFFALCTILLYTPISNMWVYTDHAVLNDRLMSFCRWYLYVFIILIVYSFLPKMVVFILAVLVVVNVFFSYCISKDFAKAATLSTTTISTFRWNNPAQKTYLLNAPAMYKGITVFNYANEFNTALYVYKNFPYQSNIECVAAQIMVDTEFVTKIIQLNDSTLRVVAIKPGEWFSYNTYGVSNRETDDYILKTVEGLPAFDISFKNKKSTNIYIYLNNGGCNEFRFKHN